MSDQEKVRLSFSYPDTMKIELEKAAKAYGMKLMGYLKVIIRKEIKELREAK
jgi:hypothetical protein